VISGIVGGIAIWIADSAGNRATKTANEVDTRGKQRSEQLQRITDRLDADDRKLKAANAVLCNAVLSNIEHPQPGQPAESAQQIKLTIRFARQFGCAIPPALSKLG
jgi:hypothetical protein